ncbi:MAG: hypothetical protein V4773_10685, partial [Verrucomicrobiota bacterium]
MNTRPLPKSLVAVLAAALLASVVPVVPVHAQNQTDAKIRLMSEALRARDAGDLPAAQKALAQLNQISPNDPAVQRLNAEVEAQVAARTTTVVVPVATPAPAIEVKIPATEQEAEALARAEAARIGELVAGGQRMLATARTQLRDGKYDEAIVTVDAALSTLPVNPLTQRLVADLQKEKASALLDRSQALLKAGDVEGARAALALHNVLAPASTRSTGLDRQIAIQSGMVEDLLADDAPSAPVPSAAPPALGLSPALQSWRAQV